jgi:DNA-binding NarL/FixJ family response regulator
MSIDPCELNDGGWQSFIRRIARHPDIRVDMQNAPGALVMAHVMDATIRTWAIVDWRGTPAHSSVREFCDTIRRRCAGSGLVAATCPAALEDRLLALEAGADDCVSYDVDPRELVAKMRAFGRLASSRAPRGCPDDLDRRARTIRKAFQLSPREEETLILIVQGVHLKEVAGALGCTYATARTHARRLARKLGCSGTLETIVKFFAFNSEP